jgi:hypothetical protein
MTPAPCEATIRFCDHTGLVRERGFQPPWHTVLLYECHRCGAEHRVRKTWSGPAPRGGFRCGRPR